MRYSLAWLGLMFIAGCTTLHNLDFHSPFLPKPAPEMMDGASVFGEPVAGLQAGLTREVVIPDPADENSNPHAYQSANEPWRFVFHLRNSSDQPIHLVAPNQGGSLAQWTMISAPLLEARLAPNSGSPIVIVLKDKLPKMLDLAPGQDWSADLSFTRKDFGSDSSISGTLTVALVTDASCISSPGAATTELTVPPTATMPTTDVSAEVSAAQPFAGSMQRAAIIVQSGGLRLDPVDVVP